MGSFLASCLLIGIFYSGSLVGMILTKGVMRYRGYETALIEDGAPVLAVNRFIHPIVGGIMIGWFPGVILTISETFVGIKTIPPVFNFLIGMLMIGFSVFWGLLLLGVIFGLLIGGVWGLGWLIDDLV